MIADWTGTKGTVYKTNFFLFFIFYTMQVYDS